MTKKMKIYYTEQIVLGGVGITLYREPWLSGDEWEAVSSVAKCRLRSDRDVVRIRVEVGSAPKNAEYVEVPCWVDMNQIVGA